MAEVTDDSCTVQFIEIVPLDRASDDCQTPAFVNPVLDVEPEKLPSVKHEPADESDSESQYFSVKVISAYAICYCFDDVFDPAFTYCHSTTDLHQKYVGWVSK